MFFAGITSLDDKDNCVDITYLDLWQAFDLLLHNSLIKKSAFYTINVTLNRLKLADRSQKALANSLTLDTFKSRLSISKRHAIVQPQVTGLMQESLDEIV